MYSPTELQAIHRYSNRHGDLIDRSDRAGCFHCGALFATKEIRAWIHEPELPRAGAIDRDTALCPRCGADAVLPSAIPVELDAELLAQMHRHFFGPRLRDMEDDAE